MRYIERFRIIGTVFGIEDYEDGYPDEDHFMAHNTEKRYRMWRNGCGIGTTDDLSEARQTIHDYAIASIEQDLDNYVERAADCRKALDKLGNDSAHLFRFEEDSDG